jgi:hypothetical protein
MSSVMVLNLFVCFFFQQENELKKNSVYFCLPELESILQNNEIDWFVYQWQIHPMVFSCFFFVFF